MVDRASGRASWTLDPYQVSVSFAARQAGQGSSEWFGPLSPIAPAAPAEVAGRQWDYPAGYNLALEPRPYAPVSFATLRQLADGYDLLRLVIETRKDQVARMAWTIKPRGPAKPDARLDLLTTFFSRPDGIHGWADWLRMLLEELFVIDAPALYCRRNRAGPPYRASAARRCYDQAGDPTTGAARHSRCETARRRSGRPPTSRCCKGFPAVDYSTRDLLYRPRNPRVNRAYGFSPVEQVVTTVNIALRRQLFLMDYFTEGTVPDSLNRRSGHLDAGSDRLVSKVLGRVLLRRCRAAATRQIRAGRCRQVVRADEGAGAEERFRRLARPHRLLRLLGVPAGAGVADEPRHRRGAEDAGRGGGFRARPRLGQGADRRRARGRVQRRRPRVRLDADGHDRPAGAGGRSSRPTRAAGSSRSTRRARCSAAIRFRCPPPTRRWRSRGRGTCR